MITKIELHSYKNVCLFFQNKINILHKELEVETQFNRSEP